MLNPLEGEIFFIDKPLKWTSFDAVKRIRGVLARRTKKKKLKVGHAGTLDPLATGVLIVCSGKATKRIDELQTGVKEYIATLEVGATTPSFDLETQVDATYPWQHVTRELLEEKLKSFLGSIMQVPPAYSACKVDGERAYKMARKGNEVELKAKELIINEIEVLSFDLPKIVIRVVCGKGTYIRALARDIGLALGSGAHLTALQRTRVGDVTIDKCHTVSSLIEFLEDAEMVTTEDNIEKE
ncbi:MAG: tRNA pseudouridine(55) synthase TruB [Muribaculaceae bacterium]|nr:tRNA pseudouridine(55) synthase TruB [Muribaculaceae bacterium]